VAAPCICRWFFVGRREAGRCCEPRSRPAEKGFPDDFPTPVEGWKNWLNEHKISVNNKQFIDCSGDTNQDVLLLTWGHNIFVYQEKDLSNPHLPTNYDVIMHGPPPCDRNPGACKKKIDACRSRRSCRCRRAETDHLAAVQEGPLDHLPQLAPRRCSAVSRNPTAARQATPLSAGTRQQGVLNTPHAAGG
jgi:hypothetical protein